jgi:FAD/FMN-containing dehydrogenase
VLYRLIRRGWFRRLTSRLTLAEPLLLDSARQARIQDRPAAVAESAADRARLWSYRERHPEAAGFLGVPVKLDVSVPAAQWVRLASGAAAVVTAVDPGAEVITFGHVADGNVYL